jgi:branched-chain amino acid transport system permease protein
MNLFIHQLLAGVAVGGIYACLALSLVMIYQTTHIVNFAQGEMAMASTFLAWVLVSHGVPYWLAFLLTVALSFAAGLAIERFLMRRFRTQPIISVVIVMIGLMITINGLAGWIFGYDVKSFESPFEKIEFLKGGYMSPHELGVLAVTLVMMALVFSFFAFTKTGLAMRAAAANPQSSSLVGINVGAMLALGWGLAAAIGAGAGVLTAPVVYLDPTMMLHVMIYAFTGAVLGGITNPWGAVAGGFILGIGENLIGAFVIGPDLKLPFVLMVIVAVVTLKPEGLFGHRVVTRV